MALCLRFKKIHPFFPFFWYWLPSVSFFMFHCTAGLSLRQVAHQRHTVLAVTSHRSASASAVTVTTSASAGVNSAEHGSSWLCRISKGYAACGSREYNGVYPPQTNMYCPDRFCCSKTACLGGCGSWCHDSWALCSTSIVYHPEWSYGNCNCKRFGHQCDENAECVHQHEDNGGVYCKCRDGFVGDGKSCVKDFCWGQPCDPGECKNVEDGYKCTCPDTHMVQITNNKESCKEKPNYCLAEPCGPSHMVKECRNTENGYECTCQQGYAVRNNRCEEVNLCADSPCGPPEAVHSCVTEREPKFRYRCQCKSGYDLSLLPDGEAQICRKNWCYDDPCGGEDRVVNCNSTENGYSCLCKETYVVETDTEGREKCVKDDVCKHAPCGPPAVAKRCYAEGSGYRCECQSGYAEFAVDGRKTCVEGDPCLLEACGSQEKVAECTTSGSNYTCTCREPDFLLGQRDGQKTCLSKEECIENCGPLDAVQTCAVTKGVYSCKCNDGYLTTYRDGRRMCVEQDVCGVAPCGSEEAVEKCTPNPVGSSSPYTCTCKEGYEVRTLEDQSEICAETGSCIGNPCGDPEIVKACITEQNTYSCQCAENYVQITTGGRRRCAPAAGTQKYEETTETESQGMSNTAIAGSVIGGLVLLGSVGAGIAYARKKEEEEEEDDSAEGGQEALEPGVPPSPSALTAGPAPGYVGPTAVM